MKNVCLKNTKTYENSLSVVFCYSLQFENFAPEIRNPPEVYLEPRLVAVVYFDEKAPS